MPPPLNVSEKVVKFAQMAFDTGWAAALDEAIALTRQASFQPYRNVDEAFAAMAELVADLERLTGTCSAARVRLHRAPASGPGEAGASE